MRLDQMPRAVNGYKIWLSESGRKRCLEPNKEDGKGARKNGTKRLSGNQSLASLRLATIAMSGKATCPAAIDGRRF